MTTGAFEDSEGSYIKRDESNIKTQDQGQRVGEDKGGISKNLSRVLRRRGLPEDGTPRRKEQELPDHEDEALERAPQTEERPSRYRHTSTNHGGAPAYTSRFLSPSSTADTEADNEYAASLPDGSRTAIAPERILGVAGTSAPTAPRNSTTSSRLLAEFEEEELHPPDDPAGASQRYRTRSRTGTPPFFSSAPPTADTGAEGDDYLPLATTADASLLSSACRPVTETNEQEDELKPLDTPADASSVLPAPRYSMRSRSNTPQYYQPARSRRTTPQSAAPAPVSAPPPSEVVAGKGRKWRAEDVIEEESEGEGQEGEGQEGDGGGAGHGNGNGTGKAVKEEPKKIMKRKH